MSHVAHMIRHVTHMCKSHICVCHAAHLLIFMGVPYMNESCRTYESSCHTYVYVTQHTYSRRNSPSTCVPCMSRVAHINESCRTYKWVTPHTYSRRIIFNVCPVHEWVVSHIKTFHFAHINEVHCTPTPGETHLQCVSRVWMRRIYEWVTLHTYSRRDSSSMCCRTYESVLSHIHAAHRLQAKLISICVSYMYVSYYTCISHDDASCDTYKWVMSYTCCRRCSSRIGVLMLV